MSGKVGIFPPRLDEHVAKEAKSIQNIKTLLKIPPTEKMTLTGDQVYGRIDLGKLDPADNEFLSTVRNFENDRVQFKISYLEQKLGELPPECYELEDFFHYVDAS